MANKPKVFLIDGNSLLYRAFFAMPHFSTLENQPTNAVYGFTMMLLNILDKMKPDIIMVAFDAHAKTFRHIEFDDYKAHRKATPDDLISQSPLAREMICAFNIPLFEIEGFEADDVVGTLALKAEKEGYAVTIVTGDLDELQMVSDNIQVMTTIKGVTDTVVYDTDAVVARFGLRPDQLPDYKGLKGDTSDNIPGVAGFGDKTAQKLISEYGSVENLVANIESIKEKRIKALLADSIDIAIQSKRLATIITDVPLDVDFSSCLYRKPNDAALKDIFTRLEFKSLLKRFAEEAPQAQMNLFDAPETVRTSVDYKIVDNLSNLNIEFMKVKQNKLLAFRIIGSTARGTDSQILGIAFGSPGAISYTHLADKSDLSISSFKELLEDAGIAKFGYNLKYEIEILSRNSICLAGEIFDTMLAAYLINQSRDTSLEGIARDFARIELSGGNIKKCDTSADIAETASSQIDALLKLKPVLQAKIKDDSLLPMFVDIETPLISILADMELAGVNVDMEWLNKLSVLLGEKIAVLENEIFKLAGTDFNIGSPKQLQTILFEKLGLPSSKKTKTGYSTDADTLNALAPAHEIVAKILEYRELTKLKSTYADSLPKLINPDTGRIHTSLNQTVAATGRLSSSDPNLQNIPIKTEIGREIRKAFIASEGNLLVSADYSQIELRILAHVSKDPELVNAFQTNQDIHTRTASTVFGVPEDSVSPEMRRQAKTVNFAVIYGMSDYGLSRELGIPVGIAKIYIENYFKKYPGVKWYSGDTLDQARSKGYVESLLGRRRYIPEINSANRQFREFAERAAVNMPIQATAADIVKIAMIRVAEKLKTSGFKAKLILQVHDELVFDVPEAEVSRIIPVIKEVMENAYHLEAPLKVDIKAGKDWCTALPVSIDEDMDSFEIS
ncbi:MAG: DNA polymerase I [Armatimonadota bacterium]